MGKLTKRQEEHRQPGSDELVMRLRKGRRPERRLNHYRRGLHVIVVFIAVQPQRIVRHLTRYPLTTRRRVRGNAPRRVFVVDPPLEPDRDA